LRKQAAFFGLWQSGAIVSIANRIPAQQILEWIAECRARIPAVEDGCA
jgi:hypothetical protein